MTYSWNVEHHFFCKRTIYKIYSYFVNLLDKYVTNVFEMTPTIGFLPHILVQIFNRIIAFETLIFDSISLNAYYVFSNLTHR